MQVLSYNANNRVWNVNFIPNKKYLKNWTFY